MPAFMRHEAPFPDDLDELVAKASFFPGWKVELRDCERHAGARGLHLLVSVDSTDFYADDPATPFEAVHYFAVPPASYNRASWCRWLFDRLCDVAYHEAMEAFKLDGVRCYPPGHGGGHDPYHAKPV